MVSRFDVFLVNIDPEPSPEPKNTRPCVVISPDEMNRNIGTVIIAPISSTNVVYPTRVPVELFGSLRHIILDQVRTVDQQMLTKKIGEVSGEARAATLKKLQELFAE